jgi:nucleotide-binding universal stress UspA family protein
MTIRTMLVHVDDGARSAARVRCAVALAQRLRARLIGTYLVPSGDITPSVGAMLPDEVVTLRMRQAADAQAAAEASFRDAARAGGLPAAEWRAPAGDPLQAILAHGRCTDLCVLGQADPDDADARFGADLVTTALLGLGRPLFIVPYIGALDPPGRRVLIASDGGREAARAIGDAWDVVEQATEVRILLGKRSDNDPYASYALTSERLAQWCRDHGIEAAIERYDAPDGDRGEWLLSRAADYGSDLVVMGGYGTPRLREVILGGMTRTMLRSMTVPVLMSH